MPDNSCRMCGETLTKYALCAICKQAMQRVCLQCGFITEAVLHRCYLESDAFQTRQSMIENTYSITV